MSKLRLVALGTLVAVVGLIYALATMNRKQGEAVSSPATSSSVTIPQAAPDASEAATTETPVATNLVPTVSSSGARDYSVLPDGRPVPELPAAAPKTCSFGAILFTFDGVQLAPRNPRTKSEALELARRVMPEAEANFAEAVKKGDPGSLADAGSISRGVLERSVEYQLFTMEKGKVYPEPIETPRGYWILRRTR